MTLAVLLALAPSCGSSDTSSPTADPTTTLRPTRRTTSTSTSTTGDASAQDIGSSVTARYIEITRRYYERLRAPDPSDPTIGEDFTGASKDGVVRRATKLQMDGQFDRPGPQGFPEPTVTSVVVDDDTAKLGSCLIDDVEVVDRSTGETVNNDVFTQVLLTTLERDQGAWKISEQELVREDAGRSGCER